MHRSRLYLVGCLVACAAAVAAALGVGRAKAERSNRAAPATPPLVPANATGGSGPASTEVGVTDLGASFRHPVVVRAPAGPPRVVTGLVDHAGRPVTVACATCHSSRPPGGSVDAPPRRDASSLVSFHQGLVFTHGDLSCASCHNAADAYASLRLADGSSLEFAQVLNLCAQCHGPTFVDWQHGAHGGMNGYWDLTRGGRTRNNCIDCHDPHAPAFPRMVPTFKPHDRFLTGREGHP